MPKFILFCITCVILLFTPKVIAAQNPYSIFVKPTPTDTMMEKNNEQLQKEFREFSPDMQNELQRYKENNKNNDYKSTPLKDRGKENDPNWWRHENSFQGWGFN